MTDLDAAMRLRLVDEVSATARRIGQVLERVGVDVKTGADYGSRAIEELRVRELAAQDQSRRLAGELRRMRAAEGASAEGIRDLSGRLVRAREEARGFGQAAREVARIEQGLARASSGASRSFTASAAASSRASAQAAGATKGSAAALGLLSKESKNAGRNLGGQINVVAELSYSFLTAIPGMQQFGTQMAMMGGSAYQLGAGFGIWGAAAGAVIGLMPVLISWFQKSNQVTDQAVRTSDRLNRSFIERLDHMREIDEAEQRANALAAGTAEVADQERALSDARSELGRARAAQRQLVSQLGALGNNSVVSGTLSRSTLTGALQSGDVSAIEQRLRLVRGVVEQFSGSRRGEIDTAQFQQYQREAQLLERLLASRGGVGAQQRNVAHAQEALESARRDADAERQFQASQTAPQQAQQHLSDLLLTSGLSERMRARVQDQLGRGRLSEDMRRRLGGRAGELLAAQEQIRRAEEAAARARLGRETFLDQPDLPPTTTAAAPAIARAPRARRAPATAAPAEDMAQLGRFAEDMDRIRESWGRTQLRVVVEDGRVRAQIEGEGRAPIEVETVSSDLIGGQQ